MIIQVMSSIEVSSSCHLFMASRINDNCSCQSYSNIVDVSYLHDLHFMMHGSSIALRMLLRTSS